MKVVIQQVSFARIHIVDNNIDETREIGKGIIMYLGIGKEDADNYQSTIDGFLSKMKKLRFLDDVDGNISVTLDQVEGEILLVSNFTLYANHKNGTKMDFSPGARYSLAKPIYEYFVRSLKTQFPGKVQTGEFGAMMNITSEAIGPINYSLEL